MHELDPARLGSVAEWSIAPVLKTGNPQGFVSSNLTASAKIKKRLEGAFFISLCVDDLELHANANGVLAGIGQ